MRRNENGSHSDDKGEMRIQKRFAERDVDAAMNGRAPADPELAAVQRALSLMKERLIMEPSPKNVSSQAAAFAAAVPSPDAAPQTIQGSPWRRRVSAVVGVAVVSAFGVAGAASADEAAPGDTLYGVDHALETVGILDGGTGERLDEAQILVSEDDVEGALELAGDALEEDGDSEAAKGLRNAALSVAKNSSGDDVRSRVSEMLQWMAEQDTRGADFGAGVSERAHQISGNANGHAKENANGNANGHAKENANGNANANGHAKENANGNANGHAKENATGTDDAPDDATDGTNDGAVGDGRSKAAVDPGSQGKAPETRGAPDTTVGRP